MVTATVRIDGRRVPVKVTRVYVSGNVMVEALQGHPFTRWTMGGPDNVNWAVVRRPALEDVKDEADNG
jgi:hypothetical protein